MSKESHIQRTANEPRSRSLHPVTLADITQVTPTIRLFRFQIPQSNNTIEFLPGQWLDLYPASPTDISTPGGFTITSSPSLTHPLTTDYPYLELAIQLPPTPTPLTQYLFQPPLELIHDPFQVRIGGSFTFPPLSSSSYPLFPDSIDPASIKKVLLVASGMGINPLMSMLSWISEQDDPQSKDVEEVQVLYGVRDPGVDGGGEILFLERIAGIFESGQVRGGVRLFVTPGKGEEDVVKSGGDGGGVEVPVLRRRMTVRDVEEAVGEDKERAVVYVCGVPAMTDEFVQALVAPEGFGMDKRRVLFEKWW